MSESKNKLKNQILDLKNEILVYRNILYKDIEDCVFNKNINSDKKIEKLKDLFLNIQEIMYAKLNK